MGNFVIIKHNQDTYTIYFHLQHEQIPPVKSGDKIASGTRIGWQGNTGWSNGGHLHFAVVNVEMFPLPRFTAKPRDSWGFIELNSSNKLILNNKYDSENIPSK